MIPSRLENLTLEAYERDFSDRHLLHGVVAHWARLKPHAPAFIVHERGLRVDWQTLEEQSFALARRLLRLGFRKGDFLATSLPFTAEQIFLEYACFRIGVIHAPLDLRMRPAEVARALNLTATKGYAHMGSVPPEVVEACPTVEHWLTSSTGILACVSEPELRAAEKLVEEGDGAQVIFTTGSTGSPKPALLSHRSITSQNFCLGGAFEFSERRVLLNLPPSHVGGQAEILMTALFYGGTAVILEAEVFPGDVEAHLAVFDGVAQIGVVGAEHRTLMEAVVAFIEPRPGAEIDLGALRRHARGMASYMRPLHYVILDPGQMPLNRVAKIDYLSLWAQAEDEIARLRALGRWDN